MTASHTTDLDMGSRLSLLWIFYMFNAAYIDITTLYYSVFINHHAKVHYTQAFLNGAGVLIEISISMVVLSRFTAVPGKSPGQHRSRRVLDSCSDRDAIRRNADFGLSVLLTDIDRHIGGCRLVRIEVV